MKIEKYVVLLLMIIISLGIGFQFMDINRDRKESFEIQESFSKQMSGSQTEDSRIDLNKATMSQLIKLPGIGPSKARAIVEYREKIGKFTDLEQLMEVPGIGEKTFERLKDYLFVEEKVYKQTDLKIIEVDNSKSQKISQDFPINVNSADLKTLQKLPGIGEVKAKAIIEYREKNGGFRTIDELKNVKGIGEKTFEKIKELVVVF